MAKFISLFAGVGGFDHGLHKANHECVAQVEWDKNAAGVLKHRWPNVPLFCDVSKVSADDLPDADFITYGFPCQDLSVAGKREGLDGKRSGLFYEATRIIKQLAERAIRRGGVGGGRFIAIAENVKGLLSSGDGYDFARCIRELHNIGASEVGWSVLDSQYLGVAQRRKRVFLIADFGGESTSEILAFSEGLPGHPPPSREAGEGTAEDATEGVGEGGKCDCDPNGTTGTLLARDYKGLGNHDLETGRGLALQAQGADVYNGELTGETSATVTSATGIANASGPKVIGWNGDTTPKASEDVSVTLRSQQGGEGVGVAHVAPTLSASNNPSRSPQSSEVTAQVKAVHDATLTVRRLTPIECERLQGFPDNWTSEKMGLTLEGNEWKATGKVAKQADGPRYKQMGNAVTVNVAEWIGKQIAKTL
jgi:DNA (cytosine-5)-methyltransferase 1